MYVVLDGFDLGIGILFPWVSGKEHRDIMMNSVAPVWDGNETWMVFGAAALYGAFPLAYSTLLPVLYLPLMIMLSALIFRGVAFEFRFKAHRSRFLWDIAFSAGSGLAAFCQGLLVGTFVHGYVSVSNGLGYKVVWFTPFSIMTGIAVVFGYALLGATWLIMRTEGELQRNMYHAAKILLVCITAFIILVSLWTPFVDADIMQRWFQLPNFFYLLPLPILTAFTVLYAAYSLHRRYETAPFVMSVLLFVFSYIGFCISIWPYIIPRTTTIWQAASDSKSLAFLLIGAAILLPILIGYSIYSYYVFKGKVRAEEGYH
ncbi:MAG: cytochrome d ubiquinol oxidase subunit II [Coxiellaceae bacterium]|nr:MAG: cytochrome d ubiquinol oxidase subunit II [Coxiellaceae bacterium]